MGGGFGEQADAAMASAKVPRAQRMSDKTIPVKEKKGDWGLGGWTGEALEYAMPLFEYECRGCGKHFEYLTRDGQTPACPACKGMDLQKLMSVFAAQSSSPAKSFSDRPMSACGSCGDPRGPGSCSMN